MKANAILSVILGCFLALACTAYGSGLQLHELEGDRALGKEASQSLRSPTGVLGGNCSDYEDLSGLPLPITVTGTTDGATGDYTPAQPALEECWYLLFKFGSGAGPDVTYKWTVPADGIYSFSLCGSGYNTTLLLYDFTCPVEPVQPDDFICGNDDACGRKSRVILPLTEGREILIVVDGKGSASGEYELVVSRMEIAPMDSLIADVVDTYHIPALSATLVKDGVIAWNGTYGMANFERGMEANDSTTFELGSISKTAAAIALMQLWEDGLFGLDDDINDYLTRFEVVNPRFPDSSITFRMLLAHTSGIADFQGLEDQYEVCGLDTVPIPLGDWLEIFFTREGDSCYACFRDWAPGTQHEYSNTGATVGGYLIEELTGALFHHYTRDSVFVPLQMYNTAWHYPDLDTTNCAMPYEWGGNVHIPYGYCTLPHLPSGRLKSSSLQLGHYLIAFMQHGQFDGVRILDSTTVDMMTTVQYPDLNPYFGLAWHMRWLPPGRRMWGHPGGTWGSTAAMFYCPDENSGFALLANVKGAVEELELIAHALLELALEEASIDLPKDRHEGPQSVVLQHTYPNPFDTRTVIGYGLPETAQVDLSVYDVRGRRVETLVSRPITAGYHLAIWDAKDISPGVYFCRIEVGGRSETVKMLKVR
jgi:CubicO group peptidase (beta-lactamase class C family)